MERGTVTIINTVFTYFQEYHHLEAYLRQEEQGSTSVHKGNVSGVSVKVHTKVDSPHCVLKENRLLHVTYAPGCGILAGIVN